MATFLIILKYIGLTLLYLLGALLLIAALLLFYPVSYKAKGSYSEPHSFDFSFKGTYLFHILSLSYIYGRDEPLKIRLFGFSIKKKNSSKKKSSAEKTSNEKQSDVIKEDKSKEIEKSQETAVNKKTEVSIDAIDGTLEKSKTLEKDDSLNDFSKSDKYDKLKRYIDILGSNTFKKAYAEAKGKILKLCKMVLPKYWLLEGSVGFEDPAITGNMLAVLGLLSPFIYKHINIKGNFDNPSINLKLRAKGRACIFSLLMCFLSIYMNKRIKRVIKLFKEG